MRRRTIVALALLIIVGGALLALAYSPARVFAGFRSLVLGKGSVDSRVREYGPDAEARLRPRFAAAGLAYPPPAIAIVILKQERELRLMVPTDTGPREAARYHIQGASGGPGPKLREGDGQVPEGFYRVESLNPNSLYHLALRVDYPSAEDRAAAAADGRARLGSNIMIHGKNASVGCVAIGDKAIEELFVLVARIGLEKTELLMAPSANPQPTPGDPAWLVGRYSRLANRLKDLGVRN
jgi:hypothetical protein